MPSSTLTFLAMSCPKWGLLRDQSTLGREGGSLLLPLSLSSLLAARGGASGGGGGGERALLGPLMLAARAWKGGREAESVDWIELAAGLAFQFQPRMRALLSARSPLGALTAPPLCGLNVPNRNESSSAAGANCNWPTIGSLIKLVLARPPRRAGPAAQSSGR